MHPNLIGTVNPNRDPAMDSEPLCSECGAPQRQIWVPSDRKPDMVTLETGNFIVLQKCRNCGRLWCHSPYEPFLSADYTVRWYLSPESWHLLHERDRGHTLLEWHKAAVQALQVTFTPDMKDGVEAHRKRTYYSQNPIDMKVERIPNLTKPPKKLGPLTTLVLQFLRWLFKGTNLKL